LRQKKTTNAKQKVQEKIDAVKARLAGIGRAKNQTVPAKAEMLNALNLLSGQLLDMVKDAVALKVGLAYVVDIPMPRDQNLEFGLSSAL
jgi:hypothetical protein